MPPMRPCHTPQPKVPKRTRCRRHAHTHPPPKGNRSTTDPASTPPKSTGQQTEHWQHLDASDLPRTEVLRHVLEYSLLAAHRHVFGVFFWFVALSAMGLGPAGAVLYRMAEFASRYWSYKSQVTGAATHDRLMNLSLKLFTWLDHVPSRMTAFGFAVVGNFEDAVASWRQDAARFPNPNDGVVLAATAGAINVRLGGEALKARTELHAPQGLEIDADMGDSDSTPGREPEVGHLRSVVGLVWRSVVVWMLLLALLTLARLLG